MSVNSQLNEGSEFKFSFKVQPLPACSTEEVEETSSDEDPDPFDAKLSNRYGLPKYEEYL